MIEPELDAALLRIKVEEENPGEPTGLDLPFFDFAAAASRPPAEPGDWVIGFTNQYEIALRDESLTVQRGVIAAPDEAVRRNGQGVRLPVHRGGVRRGRPRSRTTPGRRAGP